MGSPEAKVLLYGRVNEAITEWSSVAYYARLGRSYQAVLESGLSSFGDSYNEKQVLGWLLNVALPSVAYRLPHAPKGGTNPFSVRFELIAAQDLEGVWTLTVGSRDITVKRYVPMFFLNYYFADRITVNVYGRPFEIIEKVWEVIGARSDSYDRRPS